MLNIAKAKELIDSRGLKSQWLAQQCGIHKNTLSRALTGKASTSMETAYKIARVLGVPGHEIWQFDKGDANQLTA